MEEKAEESEEEPQTKKSKLAAASGNRGKVLEKASSAKRGKLDEVNKLLLASEIFLNFFYS